MIQKGDINLSQQHTQSAVKRHSLQEAVFLLPVVVASLLVIAVPFTADLCISATEQHILFFKWELFDQVNEVRVRVIVWGKSTRQVWISFIRSGAELM